MMIWIRDIYIRVVERNNRVGDLEFVFYDTLPIRCYVRDSSYSAETVRVDNNSLRKVAKLSEI